MTCPCQKEIEKLENVVNVDGGVLPKPTFGVKGANLGANIFFIVLCAIVCIAILPFAAFYIVAAIFFKLKTSFSTKNIINFIKLFG